MMDDSRRGTILSKLLAVLIVVALLAGGAFFTRKWWWTPVKPRIAHWMGLETPQEHDEHEEEEHEHEEDPDVLTISRQARDSLGIRIDRLKTTPVFERTIRVPGRVAEIPGESLRDVTAGLSGVITRIHVRQGQEIKPGAPLFEISLIHEAAVQLQLEFLDALGKYEVTELEIQRLTNLNRDRPDLIARSRILEQEYEKRHLNHTIESRRQALLLLGFSEKQISLLMQKHARERPPVTQTSTGIPEDFEHPLIDTIRITAPGQDSSDTRIPTGYLVSELPVHPGEHIEPGQLLCKLADYRMLYVEGRAFEHQISEIRRAMQNQWPVAAVLNPGDREPAIRRNLRILFQDPKVDPASRTTHIYVELANSKAISRSSDGRVFVDWEARPGQLVEVLVPIERLENRLVVPLEAVAQQGVENYVFQASGKAFIRRPVTVIYRDQRHAVLGSGSRIYDGDAIAASGAYQLQLALQDRAAGPVDAHHGHDH